MKAIVERTRAITVESNRTRQERDDLVRRLRRATERQHQAFDQGFAAAVRMLEAGASLERLREASGVPANEWEDTHPVPRVEFDSAPDTDVTIVPPELSE